ncbi:hypothetical protein [Paraburkholderia aromaticivorans]|uniref:hypothetical protein n=1 Tax=Paraburkholderia aromaticivorans TaxID=2026199 RepID=UPI00145624E8|nr:hypothetical protein [Paraburkholderia aromaticivorans]
MLGNASPACTIPNHFVCFHQAPEIPDQFPIAAVQTVEPVLLAVASGGDALADQCAQLVGGRDGQRLHGTFHDT